MRFYITQETRQELQNLISKYRDLLSQATTGESMILGETIEVYEEVLSKSIVLPVEETENSSSKLVIGMAKYH
jgi:hypothetical protein